MIIAISREAGCGGHEIGLRVAKKLKIPFYDKKILSEIAAGKGINTNLPEFTIDTPKENKGIVRNFFDTKVTDRNELKPLIEEVANQGDCVIVGRCANLILENSDDVVSFFIHASEEDKIARMMERKGYSVHEAKRRINHIDGERKAYFERFTGRKWRSCRSYNFSLDSGYLGLNGCVDAIIALSKSKLKVTKCFD